VLTLSKKAPEPAFFKTEEEAGGMKNREKDFRGQLGIQVYSLFLTYPKTI